MTSAELIKLLKKHGCTFEPKRGKGGHMLARRGKLKTFIPNHGGRQEIGTGLANKILKDLGVK